MDSIKQKLDEAAYIIRLQTAKIEELTAENERLKSNLTAHQTLKLIYSDPDAPASASLPHEVPKLMSVPPPLDLVAEPAESLFEQADRRMKQQEALRGRDIEVQPNGQVVFLPKRNGGNGSDQD